MVFTTYGEPALPSLLLLHGMANTAQSCYGRVVPYLDGCHVVLCQLDGHTDKEIGLFLSIEDCCEKIEGYVSQHLGGKLYGLSGFSMGATIAVELMARKPRAISQENGQAAETVSARDAGGGIPWPGARAASAPEAGGIRPKAERIYGGKLMFRDMRRSKQALSHQECVEVLKSQPRGVLSLLGDDGYPYGIPMTHWYDEQEGKLYFHGAKSGHKIDALSACDKVSFCVYDEGYRQEGEWALNIRSVVVFGRIRRVEDPKRTEEICSALCRKFSDDPDYPRREWRQAGGAVLCLELTVEHITGKLVKES